LFVSPAESGATTKKTITREGYQLLHWADADFNYWAVSDVSENDLQVFKDLFENRQPHH
jgi:anti-sigma factor RsiW